MSEWDDFVICVETQDAMVADFLRTEGIAAFDGSTDLAMAAVHAITAWWNQLDPKIKWAIGFAGGKLGDSAWKQLGVLIAEVGGVAAAGWVVADAAAYIVLFIGVLLTSFEIGVLVTASAQCLV